MRKFAVSFLLWYLRLFAKIQLFKFRPIIVGIGGASGKTSLAGLVTLILSKKYKVLGTEGKNSETGIPLSVLRIKVENYTFFEWLRAIILAPSRVILDWNKYDILVAEMGIDGPFEPKNMTYLLKIVKPKIGVLTNISFEHSVYFEEISKKKDEIFDLTAQQEKMLLKNVSRKGFVILNLDDPNIKNIESIKASKITVSTNDKSSDFYVEKIEAEINKFKIDFKFRSNSYQIKILKLLPDHYARILVMAIAAGFALGIDPKNSTKILEKNFSLPPGRMSVFKGEKDALIIDSSYNNATITPIIDLLDLLKKIAGKRRKVAVVGDMRELGIISKTYHEQVARKLLETADLVFLIGPLSKKFISPILHKNKHNFYSFNTFSESKKIINENIKKDDIILVKSSQNTLFLERVVEMLLKNPEDKKMLARRGKFWDKIRSKTA